MTKRIILDKDHALTIEPGAWVSFVIFAVLFFFIGFFEIEVDFVIRFILAGIETAIIFYNCDINGEPFVKVLMRKDKLSQ